MVFFDFCFSVLGMVCVYVVNRDVGNPQLKGEKWKVLKNLLPQH